MSKSRDIADSAATINFIDNLTSDAQTQLNTLDTAVDNISVTSGTLTKTFAQNEVATITLSSSVTTPVVSVTKEVNQTGVTNNTWDVNSTTENYTRLNSAPATTLDFVFQNLSGSSFVDAFAISEDTAPYDIAFNNDGTKVFVMGNTNNYVYEYDLSTAYDISTASYSGNSLNVGSQSGGGSGIAFNADGTKLFMCEYLNDTVYQYNLTTGFDLSTGSYASVSFSVASQATGPQAIRFKSDGTKMYIICNNTDRVYEYTLTTGFDLTTASYSGNSIDVSSQEPIPTGFDLNSDGTKAYVVGTTNDTVYEYTLSTAYDMSTGSYSGNSFSVATEEIAPNGIIFNSSGSKFFVIGAAGDDINEYNAGLSAVSLGSGSFASADVGKTIEANSGVMVLTSTAGAVSVTTTPSSFAQVASGSWEMYAVVYNTTDGDLELSGITTPYDLSSASYDSNATSFSSGTPEGVFVRNDGLKMYLLKNASDELSEYNLTTAYDLSTASLVTNLSTPSGLPGDVFITSDGLNLYISEDSFDRVYQYVMTTAWDLSTAGLQYSYTVSSQATDPQIIGFNTDGTKMFIIGTDQTFIYQYSLSTAFRVSTATYDSVSTNLSNNVTAMQSGRFNSDGTKLFILGTVSGQKQIREFSLSTGFDLSTVNDTPVNTFSIDSQDGNATGIAFAKDGEKLFMCGEATQDVYRYSVVSSNIPSGYHAVHTTTSTDSTYWTDINSMTADEAAGDGSIFYCVSTDDRSTWKIAHNTDGIRSIVRNNSGTWQYNSNGTYASTTWTNATTNTELNALQEAMTGATASVPYDLANSTEVTFTSDPGVGGTEDFVLSADGTRAYFLSSISGVGIYSSDLPSAFTGSGGSWTAAGSYTTISSQESTPKGLRFKSDGTKFYVVGYGSDTVYQYSMSTAWDVSTGSYDSVSFSVSTQSTTPFCISFSENGEHFYILDGNTKTAYQYDLTTAWDISTASYSNNSISLSSPSGAVGLDVVDSGTKMFVSFTGTIKEYSLGTAYDISTATVGTDSVSLGFTSPSIQILDNGGYMALANGSSGYLQDINVTTSYPNQMNKTQLDAVSDANHFTLANDLDLGIIFNLSSGTTVPSSDGVSINYDANVLNKGAILGTDYDFDAPAATKVRITALAANNLKVRVV